MTSRSAALSASRLKDFKQCPLLFRFRVVDQLPEPPSAAAFRGSVVHAVLEDMFDLPPAERTAQAAHDHVPTAWQRVAQRTVNLEELLASTSSEAIESEVHTLLDAYFRMEDPRRLAPAHREQFIEVIMRGLRLRGVIDRVEIAPDGRVRIIDYKTGKAPDPRFVGDVLFQMKFYALMYQIKFGVLPTRMQLLFLGNEQPVSFDPTEADVRAFSDELMGLWAQVTAALDSGDFAPRTSRLCDWCYFRPQCPAFGGPQPPAPDPAAISRLKAIDTTQSS